MSLRRIRLLAATALLATVGALAPAYAATGDSAGSGPLVVTAKPAASGTRLGVGTALYPRLVRLAHSGDANGQVLASVVSFDPTGYGAIWRSTDDGATFTRVGEIRDPGAADGFCCTSLYELPQAVGGMPAGTLVWAGSFGQDGGTDRRMSVDLWQSGDHGATWSMVSRVLSAPNTGGLWEPEMRVNAEGQLTLYYSDETQQPTHSQALMEVFSADGVTWSTPYPVVSLADSGARPGMAVVRERPDGVRLMTYEICGPGYDCDVYERTSSDGADWGDPAYAGSRIVADDGTFFRHAPTITVVDDGTAAGRVVLVGQMLVTDAGTDPGNGTTLLTNGAGGDGPWQRAAAPVQVPTAYDNYCPNYSSALLPTVDNGGVVEVATDYAGTECGAFFATGRL